MFTCLSSAWALADTDELDYSDDDGGDDDDDGDDGDNGDDEVFESDLRHRLLLSRDFLGKEKCNVGFCCVDLLHWHDSNNQDDDEDI